MKDIQSEKKKCSDEYDILHVFGQNLRSVRNKRDELVAYISDKDFNIMCCCEHWMDREEGEEFRLPGYELGSVYCRNETRGGGTAIFLDPKLEYKEIQGVKALSVENVVEISCVLLTNYNVYIMSVYRPPDGDFEMFLLHLNRAMDGIGQLRRVIVAGDFNVHFGTDERQAVQLCDLLGTYGLVPKVTEPTRMQYCLDNFFIDYDCGDAGVGVLKTGLSDHKGIEIKIRLKPNRRESHFVEKKCRPITEQGKFTFYNIIEGISWDFLKDCNQGVNYKCQKFCNLLQSAFERSFPEKKVKTRKGSKIAPWFNNNLRNMRDRLSLLHELCVRFPSPELKQKKNQFRRSYRDAIDAAKRAHNGQLISRSGNRSRTIWNIINESRGSTKARETCSEITPDQFNDFFMNIAANLLQEVHYTVEDAPLDHPPFPEQAFVFTEVTINEVRDVITKIRNKESRDIYGLNTKLVKAIKELIVLPLTRLINLCFRECVFPDCLKRAIVVPIFKKGERDDVSNYRPISLLPIISKVVEKCMASRITAFLERNSLLSDRQFGFRVGKGTAMAILDLVAFILDGFENKKHTASTFCDLSKAFDCVSHEMLIRKMSSYNFSASSVELLESYLRNRTQQVLVGGVLSAKGKIDVGVPQGSIMGPLLFILYINNLPRISMGERYLLFADDTTLSVQESDGEKLVGRACDARSRAESWFRQNHLVLNNNKTKEMLFSLREAPDCTFSREAVGFLGVRLDSTLKWDAHIDYVAGRLKRSIFVLRSLASGVTTEVLRTAYFALCHSVLSYAVVAWGHASEWHRVFSLQRRAVRIVSALGYREDCRQKFVELEILTFPNLFIFENLKYLRNHLEQYPTNGRRHPYGTRCREQLAVPYRRLNRTRDGPNYWAVKMFNKLPEDLKCLPNTEFVAGVRKLLLRNPFYSVREFLQCSLSS